METEGQGEKEKGEGREEGQEARERKEEGGIDSVVVILIFGVGTLLMVVLYLIVVIKIE